ncbi:hypothetical protein VTO42DRAFT_4071 [Malbranchea cinnamomea]
MGSDAGRIGAVDPSVGMQESGTKYPEEEVEDGKTVNENKEKRKREMASVSQSRSLDLNLRLGPVHQACLLSFVLSFFSSFFVTLDPADHRSRGWAGLANRAHPKAASAGIYFIARRDFFRAANDWSSHVVCRLSSSSEEEEEEMVEKESGGTTTARKTDES